MKEEVLELLTTLSKVYYDVIGPNFVMNSSHSFMLLVFVFISIDE